MRQWVRNINPDSIGTEFHVVGGYELGEPVAFPRHETSAADVAARLRDSGMRGLYRTNKNFEITPAAKVA